LTQEGALGGLRSSPSVLPWQKKKDFKRISLCYSGFERFIVRNKRMEEEICILLLLQSSEDGISGRRAEVKMIAIGILVGEGLSGRRRWHSLSVCLAKIERRGRTKRRRRRWKLCLGN
jgi:hypothetical protein